MADYHIDAFRIEISKNLYIVLDGFSWQNNTGIDLSGVEKVSDHRAIGPRKFLEFPEIILIRNSVWQLVSATQ
jgi:hypothetical protein